MPLRRRPEADPPLGNRSPMPDPARRREAIDAGWKPPPAGATGRPAPVYAPLLAGPGAEVPRSCQRSERRMSNG